MTLADLKDAIDDIINDYGDEALDLEVGGEYDYGDHSHTRAISLFKDVRLITPEKSAYSDSGFMIPRHIEEEPPETFMKDKYQMVVLLGD